MANDSPRAVGDFGTKVSSIICHLELTREGDQVTISAHEYLPGEESTLRHYEQTSVSMDRVEEQCRQMVETLNRANRKGQLAPEVLTKIKEVGQVLYDEFFPITIKERLAGTQADYLKLYLDDQLVHVPWELFHDGERFLCTRFNMGRLVRTRQVVSGSRSRELSHPLRMLILADPEGDLKGAYTEGTRIRDYMDLSHEYVDVTLRSGNIDAGFVKEKIKSYDVVHFAGHADYHLGKSWKSGWRLTRENLTSEDITKMGGSAFMPALIFSNACQSARTERWTLRTDFQNQVFGLANAFLLAGVKHYVGTFWEVLDQPSSHFALEFYRLLLAGNTTGEAVRLARQTSMKQYGEENVVWASYLLYGDPTSQYLSYLSPRNERQNPQYDQRSLGSGTRARDHVIDFSTQQVMKKDLNRWALFAGLAALIAVLLFGYSHFSSMQVEGYEKAALASYHEGKFEKALDACDRLGKKRPDAALAHLIRAKIELRRGKLENAEAMFQNALASGEMTDSQRAQAFLGLGRVASLRENYDEALKRYQQATEAAPDKRQGYLSQGLVLESVGKHSEALNLLMAAEKMGPDTDILASLMEEIQEKAEFDGNKAKRDRIDQLVEELSNRTPHSRIPASDGWTSTPLTMWVMGFKVDGYSLQEGQARLVTAGIVDRLIERNRVQLVERAFLDKVLGELKLGTGDLTDSSTALSIGRMVAARLILSGRVVYSEAQTQVAMHLVETETGRITVSINEVFPSLVSPSIVAEKLTEELVAKIAEAYPLRGTTLEVDGNKVRINIGHSVGVKIGDEFKVINDKGILQIESVNSNMSLARIVKGENSFTEGMRVEVSENVPLGRNGKNLPN